LGEIDATVLRREEASDAKQPYLTEHRKESRVPFQWKSTVPSGMDASAGLERVRREASRTFRIRSTVSSMPRLFLTTLGASVLLASLATTSTLALVFKQSRSIDPDSCRTKNTLVACPGHIKYVPRFMSHDIDVVGSHVTLTSVTEEDDCQNVATITFEGLNDGVATYHTVSTGNVGACHATFRGMAGTEPLGPVKVKIFLPPPK
jgi:hypothetical protein